jgi:hypothetical protein
VSRLLRLAKLASNESDRLIWSTLGDDLQSGANLNRAIKTTATGTRQRHEISRTRCSPRDLTTRAPLPQWNKRPFPNLPSMGEKRLSPRRKTG